MEEIEETMERQMEQFDSESSWSNKTPKNFNTIREFFDHMKIQPKELDGLMLENLIRDVVNKEVCTLHAQ